MMLATKLFSRLVLETILSIDRYPTTLLAKQRYLRISRLCSSSHCRSPCAERTLTCWPVNASWNNDAMFQEYQRNNSIRYAHHTAMFSSSSWRGLLRYGGLDWRNRLTCNELNRYMSVMSSVVKAAPVKVQPYLKLMRLDKPIGTWLCFWPCSWGVALAADPGHFPNLYMLALCGVGALVVRGAGCTINDMWDRDFDKSVERTFSRPIASGNISRSQALVFLGAQLSVALGILLSLNTYSIVLGCVSMVPIIIYPLMKRFTYWPQAFLGMTFNFGALIGYAAIRGSCDGSILSLYAACIAWTIVYDTIYGHQDKKDDLTLGLKSTSIMMGDHTKYWLTGFGAAMTFSLLTAGVLAEQTYPYYIAVALSTAHIGNQIWSVDIHNPEDCWNTFRSNNRLGAIIFAGIVAGTLAKMTTLTQEKDAQHNEIIQ